MQERQLQTGRGEEKAWPLMSEPEERSLLGAPNAGSLGPRPWRLAGDRRDEPAREEAKRRTLSGVERDLLALLRITALALANIGVVAIVVAGIAAILMWAHPDATDMGQWAVIAVLAVRVFLLPPRRS